MSKNASKRVSTDLPWNAFCLEADRDYLLARWIHFSGSTFHSRAGFFAQQACEKYMKAEMVGATKGFLKTHRLHELADDCAKRDPMFRNPKLRNALAVFDDFAELGRYGGHADKNHADIEVYPGVDVMGAWVWHGTNIHLLDAFVFNVRRKFDFATISFRDQLAAIAEDADCMLTNQWRGRPSLKEIFLMENPYFDGRVPSPDKP